MTTQLAWGIWFHFRQLILHCHLHFGGNWHKSLNFNIWLEWILDCHASPFQALYCTAHPDEDSCWNRNLAFNEHFNIQLTYYPFLFYFLNMEIVRGALGFFVFLLCISHCENRCIFFHDQETELSSMWEYLLLSIPLTIAVSGSCFNECT